MNEVKALSDVREAVEVCRACGFCDSYCAVFPAIERQRVFSGGDLRYLAYLCHNCRGCYYACQSAPEPIDINLPRSFAVLRDESHVHNIWPQTLTSAFRRNGLIVSLTSVICIMGVLLAVFLFDGPSVFVSTQLGANAFYRIVPWVSMAGIAGMSMLFSVLALTISGRKFWRESGGYAGIPGLGDILVALRHMATLKNLGGDGHFCGDSDKTLSTVRKRFHHAMAYGFLSCFMATCAATVLAHFFGEPAPYPLLSVPVVLGTCGGCGIVIGTSGLIWLKIIADPATTVARLDGADFSLLGLLWLVAASGLFLLATRDMPFVGVVLAVHLGAVLALFMLLPYSKFVHSVYRGLALVRAAVDARRSANQVAPGRPESERFDYSRS